MQAYTEILPASAVSHAVTLPFLSSTAVNLAIARTSILQIFSLQTVTANAAPSSLEANEDGRNGRPGTSSKDGIRDSSLYQEDLIPQRLERIQTSKLVLEAEYPISGTIISLARIKISKSISGAEALLIGVKDAKISLVAWDPTRHTVYTVSVHYYESENLQRCPWSPALDQCSSVLTVDPGNRCAALKFGPRNLAILPFRHAGSEDLDMDDYDPDLDGERPQTSGPQNGVSENGAKVSTPYASSFVLSLTLLDPNLVYPIHLSFLYEYREPAFGILSSIVGPTPSLQQERQDILTYNIFTLDLDQRASTTLLSVSGLPSDLVRIIPLKAPVGGALLVGSNEFVHIDQAGKVSAIAVNEFARQNSAVGMADQASLEMHLEWCEVVELGLDTGEMLIILHTGELAILGFKLDGRTVSGLTLRRVDSAHGGASLLNGASCVSLVGRGKIFVGGDDTDSVLLGWTRGSIKSEGMEAADEFNFEEMRDYDDDLYAEEGDMDEIESPSSSKRDKDFLFRAHDKLANLAPLRDLKIGKKSKAGDGQSNSSLKTTRDLEILVACGSGKAGAVTILKRDIEPVVKEEHELAAAQSVWMVRARRPALRGLPQPTGQDPEDNSADSLHHRYMVRSSIGSDNTERSAIFDVSKGGSEELNDTEFDGTGGIVEIGTLSKSTRIVQVLKGQIRSFDGGKSESLTKTALSILFC
jgi:cleavage and polyadenylation specificity factor subunit 1